MDLLEQITQQMHALDEAIKRLARNGEALAEAEKAYKMELTKQALLLKDEGYAVTFINQILHGLDEVADLRFKRDCAKANYEANYEFINITKLKLRLLEAQISREWGKE